MLAVHQQDPWTESQSCKSNIVNQFISQVSWIRKRDLHILTAGILTYTSDQRFQVIRPDKSDNWTLQIKFPQLRDSGVYECQVNTEPKISLPFVLNVIGEWFSNKIVCMTCRKGRLGNPICISTPSAILGNVSDQILLRLPFSQIVPILYSGIILKVDLWIKDFNGAFGFNEYEFFSIWSTVFFLLTSF